jgi:predicted RNase H-like nuclease (RuvC/YqgF family)
MKKKEKKEKRKKKKELAVELTSYVTELQDKLNIANNTVAKQMEHIEMLNRQLELQDKAIEYKDKQFLGLRSAYRDELINNGLKG